MPVIPCLTVDEEILRLKEIAMLEWICCAQPNPSQWEDPEDKLFMTLIRYKMVRGTLAHLPFFLCQTLWLEILLLSWMN